MPLSIPYLCSRCLRASKTLPRPTPSLSKAYHTPSRRLLSSPRASCTTTLRTTYIPFRPISSTAALLKPTLEPQTSTPSPPPPPPPATNTTTTLLNPRIDEETGEAMSIAITPRAANRLHHIMTKDGTPNLCLRISVESGGCHGFQYLMSLVDISKVDESEDTLFTSTSSPLELNGDWRTAAAGKAKVVMDEPSLELLKGSKVDYTMELIGSQFKIADNPRASSSCGCGTSFDVKI